MSPAELEARIAGLRAEKRSLEDSVNSRAFNRMNARDQADIMGDLAHVRRTLRKFEAQR